jgi:DNA helicase-2/ATP-dependent DNA helicase PcrA
MNPRAVRARVEELLATIDQPSDLVARRHTLDALARHLGYEVIDDPALRENELGLCDGSLAIIRLNASLSPAMRTYVFAHELGHAALHAQWNTPDTAETLGIEWDDREGAAIFVPEFYHGSRQDEREAEAFAVYLLTPPEMVRKHVLANDGEALSQLANSLGVPTFLLARSLLEPAEIEPEYPVGTPQSTVTLTDKQEEAVSARSPALIIAGPGAGKTRILVERFQRLTESGLAPSSILALTYSNRAAEELRERVAHRMGSSAATAAIYTFHGFGLEIVRRYGPYLQEESVIPELLMGPSLLHFVLRNTEAFPDEVFPVLNRPFARIPQLLQAVTRAKDELLTPQDVERLVRADPKADRSLAPFYTTYQALMEMNLKVDFGDLISRTVSLLQQSNLGPSIRSKFRAVLVDETQDINYACSEMIRELDGGRGVTWAVGDPRQSIYRFRGASSVSLNQFKQRFLGAEIIELTTNYRSCEPIVRVSQSFPFPKREAGDDLSVHALESGRKDSGIDGGVFLAECASETAELETLVEDIRRQTAPGNWGDCAVLCNSQARVQTVAAALQQAGIPAAYSGPLTEEPLFRDSMAALYLAVGDSRALIRLWTGTPNDLPVVSRGMTDVGLAAIGRGELAGLAPESCQSAACLAELETELYAVENLAGILQAFWYRPGGTWRNALVSDAAGSDELRERARQLRAIAKAFDAEEDRPDETGAAGFLRFLTAVCQADLLREGPAPREPGAVTIGTIHSAKGLEWRAVYLPFLAKGKMPTRERTGDGIVLPNGLIRGADPKDGDIERACLFYVAMTRARDRLVLSYAQQYGARKGAPSPYLTELLQGEAGECIQPLDPAEPTKTTTSPNDDANHPPVVLPVEVRLNDLGTYERCPRQYYYRHVLRAGESEATYPWLVTVFREVLAACRHGDVNPDIEEMLDDKWDQISEDAPWPPHYRNAAIAAVRAVLQEYPDTEGRLAHSVPVDNHEIRLVIDDVRLEGNEVEALSYHLSEPRRSEPNSTAQIFPVEALRERYPQLTPRVRSYFPLYQAATPSRVVKDKLRQNRVQKVSEFLADIERGVFPCRTGRPCQWCDAALVCDRDGEESEE